MAIIDGAVKRYADDDQTELLQAYDRDLAQHYHDEGRSTPDAAWTARGSHPTRAQAPAGGRHHPF